MGDLAGINFYDDPVVPLTGAQFYFVDPTGTDIEGFVAGHRFHISKHVQNNACRNRKGKVTELGDGLGKIHSDGGLPCGLKGTGLLDLENTIGSNLTHGCRGTSGLTRHR